MMARKNISYHLGWLVFFAVVMVGGSIPSLAGDGAGGVSPPGPLCAFRLPSGPVTMTVDIFEYLSCQDLLEQESSLSYFFSGIGEGYDLDNRSRPETGYPGYCVDLGGYLLHYPYSLANYTVQLYSSVDLPDSLSSQQETWNQINYLINHRGAATWIDLQAALWALLYNCTVSGPSFCCPGYRDDPFPYGCPDGSAIDFSVVASLLREAAGPEARGFSPKPGDRVAIVVEPTGISCPDTGDWHQSYCEEYAGEPLQTGFMELTCQPRCALRVSKNCRIVEPLQTDFACDEAKPVNGFTMILAEDRPIDHIDIYKGEYDSDRPEKNYLYSINGPIAKGDEVSVQGYAAAKAKKDVDWVLYFADGTVAISRFHLSCSDPDMNGPEDCGKLEGNSKNNKKGLNIWRLEGIDGVHSGFQCPQTEPPPSQVSHCSFEVPPPPHCMGKVTLVDLRYLGGGCTIEPNAQGGKADCKEFGDGGPYEPVRIKVSDGKKKVYLDTGTPANVRIGDILRATASRAGKKKFGADTYVEIFNAHDQRVQQIRFHTSCSKPLNLGDRFGAVQLVTIESTEGGRASLGADVHYDYAFENDGNEIFVGRAEDDQLGLIAELRLQPGESYVTGRTTFVVPSADGTWTHTVTVSGDLVPDSEVGCMAEAAATITRYPSPPLPPEAFVCQQAKPLDGLTMVSTEQRVIRSIAVYRGKYDPRDPNHDLMYTIPGPIYRGDTVVAEGYAAAAAKNDVEWVITFDDGSIGVSRFHRSCSDVDMNGPEDCGKLEGNGKDNDRGLNIWQLKGLSGNGLTLQCPEAQVP